MLLITGRVIPGRKLGREIGFPTINLNVPKKYTEQDFGVFVVEVFIDANKYFGIANFGVAPTINFSEPKLEIHLIDFNQELKNELVTVQELHRIRDIRKFKNLDALKEQINMDLEFAKKYLELN